MSARADFAALAISILLFLFSTLVLSTSSSNFRMLDNSYQRWSILDSCECGPSNQCDMCHIKRVRLDSALLVINLHRFCGAYLWNNEFEHGRANFEALKRSNIFSATINRTHVKCSGFVCTAEVHQKNLPTIDVLQIFFGEEFELDIYHLKRRALFYRAFDVIFVCGRWLFDSLNKPKLTLFATHEIDVQQDRVSKALHFEGTYFLDVLAKFLATVERKLRQVKQMCSVICSVLRHDRKRLMVTLMFQKNDDNRKNEPSDDQINSKYFSKNKQRSNIREEVLDRNMRDKKQGQEIDDICREKMLSNFVSVRFRLVDLCVFVLSEFVCREKHIVANCCFSESPARRDVSYSSTHSVLD